jgi:hypothetical protein
MNSANTEGKVMKCPECGKQMKKRNYRRTFDKTKSVYQWRCEWKCRGVIYVDHNNNRCEKP